MIKTICAYNMMYDDSDTQLEFESATECPLCHTALDPKAIAAVVYSYRNKEYATILNYCHKCKRCFIVTYKITIKNKKQSYKNYFYYLTEEQMYSGPQSFQGKNFEDSILILSPGFVEIYNQAECAEVNDLSQISGMGYRKALEFLIKDYAIHFYPEEKEEIKSISLMNCIKKYIDNPKIKTLAEKSAWLGNDETHYIKKHTDRDISDLKIFINACVGYIESELAVEDANSIQSKA